MPWIEVLERMSSPGNEQDEIGQALERIDDFLRAQDPYAARSAGLDFVAAHPGHIDGWILLGRAHIELRDFDKALFAADCAIGIDGKHPVARLLRIDALQRCGRNDEAAAEVARLESDRKFDPAILRQIGQFYTRTNRHDDAARVYERVRILLPADKGVLYNLASAYTAIGDMEKAEGLYDAILKKDVHGFDSYYTRATLRKQTPERNHVAAMEQALAGLPPFHEAEHVVCYALAKELEDLKDYPKSFTYLKRGADARRRTMDYRVETDVDMIDEAIRAFDAGFFAAPPPGHGEAAPFFVLGLPRSGTTLVDRILSSHSTVGSVGESDEFSHALARLAPSIAPGQRAEIALVKGMDFAELGREYCRAIDGLLPGYAHLLDKTPRNFIYVGLILTALPNARIVHLRRHPVDSCYAIYKTLFREGCQYSYDLTDLGRYYLAYRKLMAHWRAMLPGRFFDVSYEELVDKQEEITRAMIAFCSLPWEDACLSFEKNKTPSLTASAAQVRQPIYKTSVALWRRYESGLAPLLKVLRDGGVEID